MVLLLFFVNIRHDPDPYPDVLTGYGFVTGNKVLIRVRIRIRNTGCVPEKPCLYIYVDEKRNTIVSIPYFNFNRTYNGIVSLSRKYW